MKDTSMQIGDVVRLKSGGPKMTITALDEAQATCVWFNRNGRNQSDDFPLATIEMFVARQVEPEPAGKDW